MTSPANYCNTNYGPEDIQRYETCPTCRGAGYSNHPDSGEICETCGGSGGVECISPAKIEHTPTPPLLPCPFCGSLFIKLNTIRDGATMACHDCMAQGPAKFSPNAREKSREAWNARVTAANSHADLHEALKGATIAANIAGSLLKEKDARIADLVKALEKLRSYNVDIAAGRINYRPHDHIQVIDDAFSTMGREELAVG